MSLTVLTNYVTSRTTHCRDCLRHTPLTPVAVYVTSHTTHCCGYLRHSLLWLTRAFRYFGCLRHVKLHSLLRLFMSNTTHRCGYLRHVTRHSLLWLFTSGTTRAPLIAVDVYDSRYSCTAVYAVHCRKFVTLYLFILNCI
jgi:hypothetical protein